MITYLVNFTLCSAMLMLAYQLLLKNKTMYTFNRWYLLVSIIFSLTVPFAVVKRAVVVLPSAQSAMQQIQLVPAGTIQNQSPDAVYAILPATAAIPRSDINYALYAAIAIYIIVTLLQLYRFAKNLNTIRRSILYNPKIDFNGAQLVLIEDNLTPHTFLNYIFINKEGYNNHQIEADILRHELTHASQRHSADVIFIELVQAICWFNPFIWFYRKAIQLNHEFIADAAVLNSNQDILGYQHLLLEKIGYDTSLSITSQFNYSVTKKRLIMMSKTTSKVTAALARLAVIPVMAAAFVLFCTKTEAQRDPVANKHDIRADDTTRIKTPHFIVRDNPLPGQVIFPSTKEGVMSALLDEYGSIAGKYPKAGNGRVANPEKITQADKDKMIVIYKQMSIAQQQQQSIGFTETPPPPPVPAQKVPTQQQLNLWSTSSRYSVWVDLNQIKNADLRHYKTTELYFWMVNPAAKDINMHSTHKKTVTIWTNTYYKKYKEYQDAYRPGVVMFFRYPAPDASGQSAGIQFAPPKVIVPDYPSTKEGVSDDLLNEYKTITEKYTNPKVVNTRRGISKTDNNRLEKIFKQMSREQQQKQLIRFVNYKGTPLPKVTPTQAQYDAWKDPNVYGVWLNDKHVGNAELGKYQASDISQVFVSRLLGAARVNKKYRYQVDLMTTDYYNKYRAQQIASAPITVMQYNPSHLKM